MAGAEGLMGWRLMRKKTMGDYGWIRGSGVYLELVGILATFIEKSIKMINLNTGLKLARERYFGNLY